MREVLAGTPPAVRPPRPRGRPDAWAVVRWVVALLVSGAILAFLFASQDVDPRAIVPLIRAISLPGLLGYVLVSTAGLVLRALRYRLLLGRPVPLWPLLLVTAVRNMAVDLVPARAGAVVSYLYLVTARLGLPVEAAVASFAASFILDALALAPLLVLALLAVGSAPMPPALLVAGSVLILAGSVAALRLMAPLLRLAGQLARRLPARASRIAPVLIAAAGEVERLERARTLWPALALSLALRLVKYGAYYCLLQALLVSRGQQWGSLSFPHVFLSVAGAELVSSIPLPTIASLGTYEAAGALGFAFWLGLPRDLATLAVTAFHGLSQVHDYGLGLLALLWIMAPWSAPRAAVRRAEGSPGAEAGR